MPRIEISERFTIAVIAALLYPRTGDAKKAVEQAQEIYVQVIASQKFKS